MTDVLDALRARFLARCVSDLAHLQRLAENDELGSLEMRNLVHSLAGAAGTFGFPEISLAAGRIDDAFVDDRLPERFDVEALARAIETALRSSG